MRPLIKSKDLNRWFWRWHIIAGLATLPIVFLLCVTGVIYLFKQDYNDWRYQSVLQMPAATISDETVSYQQQLDRVLVASNQAVKQVYLPQQPDQPLGFRLLEKGHARHMMYTNPYTGEITGEIDQKDTLMYDIRKLHGELLLHKPGTLTVELVASWFVVLLITGMYVWWPARRFSSAGFFTIRFKRGSRILWRDLHVVFGFWMSVIMLIIIAGAMPWTDVFGGGLKWVQKHTDSGYPTTWRRDSGLFSNTDNGLAFNKSPLTLDQMVEVAQQQGLAGKLVLTLPQKTDSVFTLRNRAFWLEDQQVIHFDQYSGEIVKRHTWDDVGILMELRQIFMRLHQGEYGRWNWWIVFIASALFALSTLAGLISYLKRKPEGRWGLPQVPESFRVGQILLLLIAGLAILFPMFGLSCALLISASWLAHRIRAVSV